jgi:hypothetical protein
MISKHRAVAVTSAAITLLLASCTGDNGVAVRAASSSPTAAVASRDGLAGAVKTTFHGLYFPAGMAGTGSECPVTWEDPFFCIMDRGTWTQLPGSRVQIRDMTVYELAFSWRDDGAVEPRKTGYDVVVANANLDSSLTGPTWGTWNLYSFDDELMFTGTFTGAFENGIPAVHFVGQGTGAYEGQQMRGDIARSPDESGNNMYGWILEPGG